MSTERSKPSLNDGILRRISLRRFRYFVYRLPVNELYNVHNTLLAINNQCDALSNPFKCQGFCNYTILLYSGQKIVVGHRLVDARGGNEGYTYVRY